ncbi:MAG: hypothetical protein QXX08_04285 [Candidatus Bathyarchaeia archaeon]
METLVERVESLIEKIDQKAKVNEKTQQLRGLVGDFILVNKELSNVVLASHFVMTVSKDTSLNTAFNKLRSEYQDLRNALVDLWGEHPERIDTSEPAEFKEPLSQLLKDCQELETKMLNVLRRMQQETSSLCSLAKSFSIIPDIEINLKAFEDAKNFLENAGHDTNSIVQFLRESRDGYNERIKTWNSIAEIVEKQKKKLDLQNIKGGKLSKKTIDFLSRFINNRGEIDFDSLNPEVVDELKSKFPELSKKLRVIIH